MPAATAPGIHSVIDAPMTKIPVFIRPGSIIPRKFRLRRSSKLMHYDPFTLVIAPLQGSAQGTLYLDDEHTLAHETTGAYAYRQFTFADNTLTCSTANPMTGSAVGSSSTSVSAAGVAASTGFDAPNTVERVILAGQMRAPKSVTLVISSMEGADKLERPLDFVYDADKQTVTVKKPDVRVVQDWSLKLEF